MADDIEAVCYIDESQCLIFSPLLDNEEYQNLINKMEG